MTQEKPITIEALLETKEPKAVLENLPFEQSMKLLEELVVAVERGSLPLERAIQSYEKGAMLVDHLRSVLSEAEARLTILKSSR